MESLPVPYFTSQHATLYLADARTILPALPSGCADLLITDPPYGASWGSGFAKRKVPFGVMAGDDGNTDIVAILALATSGPLRNKRHVYVFGYPPDALREPMRLGGTAELVWDKARLGLGDLSSVWARSHERLTFGVHMQSKCERDDGRGNLSARLRQGSVLRHPRLNAVAARRHPTEKPVPLIRSLVESSSMFGDTVLVPFAGVGSEMVAALIEGRRAIGVEIDEKYAAIAAQRLAHAEKVLSHAIGI